MAILSKRLMSAVGKIYNQEYGLRPCFIDLAGNVVNTPDMLSVLSNTRRKRDYSLQESINLGEPYIFQPVPGIVSWIVGLEDRRMIHGGLMGGEVLATDSLTRNGTRGAPVVGTAGPGITDHSQTSAEIADYLACHGMDRKCADKFVAKLESWQVSRVHAAAGFLQRTFYEVSGWSPELMQENKLKAQQREQIAKAIEDQRNSGKESLYAFEKERVLLANIRAGDRNEARRILNEMLAVIYMSSPRLVVLRARTVELMSCLTRAAIEDNPLMEPLIERNHAWTERLVKSKSFEELSQVLMDALDDFIEALYLHSFNRSNTRVRRAVDFISRNFTKKMSLETIAAEAGLSVCRLSHVVKECTGRTVLQIVQEVRVRHAQHLLERTSKSCTDIAYEVGYGDQSYFIKQFKHLTGTTPSRYRRSRIHPPPAPATFNRVLHATQSQTNT